MILSSLNIERRIQFCSRCLVRRGALQTSLARLQLHAMTGAQGAPSARPAYADVARRTPPVSIPTPASSTGRAATPEQAFCTVDVSRVPEEHTPAIASIFRVAASDRAASSLILTTSPHRPRRVFAMSSFKHSYLETCRTYAVSAITCCYPLVSACPESKSRARKPGWPAHQGTQSSPPCKTSGHAKGIRG